MSNKQNYIYKPRYVWKDLKLKPNESDVYCIILGFETAWTGCYEDLVKLTNLSKSTIQNIVNKLVEKEYIIKEQYNFKGKARVILVAKFDKKGMPLSEETIQEYLQNGLENLNKYYEKTRTYKKKKCCSNSNIDFDMEMQTFLNENL